MLLSLCFLTADFACTTRDTSLLLLRHLLLVFQRLFLPVRRARTAIHFTIFLLFYSPTTTTYATANTNFSIGPYATTLPITTNNNNNNNHPVSMVIPSVIGDWSTLEDIYFRFGEHYTPEHNWTHKAFDWTYSSNLPDFNVIFEDGSARTKLKSDAI